MYPDLGVYVLFIDKTDKYKYGFWERVRYIESGRYILFMDVFFICFVMFLFCVFVCFLCISISIHDTY